jgi:hypothetical protein
MNITAWPRLRTLLVLWLVLPLLACGAGANHERIGITGAGIAMVGLVTQLVGREAVAPNDQTAGIVMQTTGGAALLTGLLMAFYAMDAGMRNNGPEVTRRRMSSHSAAWRPE